MRRGAYTPSSYLSTIKSQIKNKEESPHFENQTVSKSNTESGEGMVPA